ncbi:hypothetical protein [Streptomyces sp. PT12]|uniref:hypothetical protein n=1 Tax=Streptomyces sp. PT12 TaxID=1510197 RepID=UPI000DE3DBBD|nr:hypothetical protein [Streptomyces sp. PT12]RBM24324.1 hypothetical protein DEH69_00165 [Streptomyces sp. PT12]
MSVAQLPADLAAMPGLREDDAGRPPASAMPVTHVLTSGQAACVTVAVAIAVGDTRPVLK